MTLGYLKVSFSFSAPLEASGRTGWIPYPQAKVGCRREWGEDPSPDGGSPVIPLWTTAGVSGGQSVWWAEAGRPRSQHRWVRKKWGILVQNICVFKHQCLSKPSHHKTTVARNVYRKQWILYPIPYRQNLQTQILANTRLGKGHLK